MNRVVTLLTLVLIFGVCEPILSQDGAYSFGHGKRVGDMQVVYFDVIGMPDDNDEQSRVLEYLVLDENIFDGNMFFVKESGLTKCQLEISAGLSVDYVNSIIRSTGYEIDLSKLMKNSIEKVPKGVYFSTRYTFFDGFDGRTGYDRERSMEMTSEDYYDMQKQKWISQNQSEYIAVKKKSTDKIIIKEKDLEIFSEEKRNRILNNPDKYLIEE